jgi:hypothetical protein
VTKTSVLEKEALVMNVKEFYFAPSGCYVTAFGLRTEASEGPGQLCGDQGFQEYGPSSVSALGQNRKTHPEQMLSALLR